MPIIKSHQDLAEHIAGRRVLHLNSLGKDSLVCLEWLARKATCEVVSLHFARIGKHPDDAAYLKYLKRRYPNVHFIEEQNPWELSDKSRGTFQSPIEMLTHYSDWEHYAFDPMQVANDVAKENGCDFICLGHSKYESVTRASLFYKKGLVQENKIYPIGLLTKEQILKIISTGGLKVHPSYRFAKGTHDRPSYYKMRANFIAQPSFRKVMLEQYPLLELDEYRFKELFK